MVLISEEEANSSGGFDLIEEGPHHSIVREVEVREGVKFGLTYREKGTGRYVMRDWLTFRGKALGIAIKKSQILGALKHPAGEFDTAHLQFIGREALLNIVHETSNRDGKMYAKAGGEDAAFWFGYAKAPEKSISHPDAQPPDEPAHPGEIPF